MESSQDKHPHNNHKKQHKLKVTPTNEDLEQNFRKEELIGSIIEETNLRNSENDESGRTSFQQSRPWGWVLLGNRKVHQEK